MKIIGVGAGPGLLTLEAISAIESAGIIFGSKRAIELAGEHIKCQAFEIEDYKLRSLPQDAIVLSTGDPMLSGLGKFAKKGDVVIPGISSLQLACSRIGKEIEGMSIITAHSRDSSSIKGLIIRELKVDKNVFILPDAAFGIKELADLLKYHDLPGRIWVFENLAYPDENISEGTSERPPVARSELYCMIVSRVY